MNLALRQKAPLRWKRGILYGMLLLAVLVSLPLGMVIAAMGAWFTLQGSSLVYLLLGLVIVLAGLAFMRYHSIFDIVLLVLLALVMMVWWISGDDAGARMPHSIVELAGRIDLLFGLLVIMVLALLIAHRRRPFAHPAAASVR